MEVAPGVQEANSRAASLLASLNFQRGQAQFCDCVVRQRQNLSKLHPAHRCVLAASSPVLASILSSSGALVELQAPCLSDSVLALLLDYIYTGALPYTRSQHQYYNLLAAASHLQMNELQEALKTWHQTADETNSSAVAKNQPYKDINNTYSKTVNTFSKHLPLSLERNDHQYSPIVDTCDYLDPCRTSSKNGTNHCSRKDVSTMSNASTCRVNTVDCRQVTHLTPEDLIQNIPCIAEGHAVSRVDKEVQKDPLHSAYSDCIKDELEKTHEERRGLTLSCTAEVQEEEMSRAEKKQPLCLTVKSKAEEKETNRKEEDKTQTHLATLLCLSASHLKENVPPSQCSSSSSSSAPHPCCGAVPVIRHSSKAAVLHLAEVSPPHHPVSQASCSSNTAPDSPSGSTDSDSIVEGNTATHKNHYGEQNNDYRYNKEDIGTQSWDHKDSLNQSHNLKQDFNSSSTDHFTGQNDEHTSNGLPHITDHNDHHAQCDSFQNKNHTKHLRDGLVPENEDSSNFARELEYKPKISFDDFTSKRQRLDCSDCLNVWMATAAEEQYIRSQDTRDVVSRPVQNSDTGSDSHCEDLCSEGETKDEYSYSRYPAGTDRQDSHCNLYEPKVEWYPNLHQAERSRTDAASSQHEHDSDNGDTPMMDKRHSVDVCQPVSTTPESCLDSVTGGLSGIEHRASEELGKMSGTELTEPHLTFTMSMAHNHTTDPTHSVLGPSYRGHLQYHCIPQEEAYLSHRYSGRKHSHPSHPEHSDQSCDEGEVSTFASPGYSPLRQEFVAGSTDQILLLDINAKPAELLVANAIQQKQTFGNEFGNNDREQWTESTSVACVTEYQVGKTNVEERKSVGKDQSRPEAEVIHKAGVEKVVSNPKHGQSQTPTLAVCSPTSVQDSIEASMSSTLSICIPSTLAASMATNISVHLPNPVHHPFKCSLCDRSFSQRGSLNRHVRSHLGVRPFPCPRCHMTFSRQYRVTEHMRVHQRCVLESDFQQPPAPSI
ncbi:uncharacterized protein LOC116693388 [Etheostoma spectabile]|uniref:uncharacterized protein LOC116693388 n=1 Tax=Etheostoma spectabile TaxID=54343 RepID=UPI0013AF0E1B|nr:uncharacterized protein LOC116693388 [Etheostoma spectabile]